MKKILFPLLLCLIFLVGCSRGFDGEQDVDDTLPEDNFLSGVGSGKQDYFVETKKIIDFSSQPVVSKVGKISGKSDVVVKNQISGKISSIVALEGEYATKNQIVVSLEDSSKTYSFAVKRAAENLSSAKLTYQQNKVTLDNTLSDLSIGRKQAEHQLSVAQKETKLLRLDVEQQMKDVEQQLKDANRQEQLTKISIDSTDSSSEGSLAMLQLEQLDQQIQKAEFDLSTKIVGDDQTLENFSQTAKVLHQDILILRGNVLDDVDEVLGVSSLNQTKNDSFEVYLGARDSQTFRDATDLLRGLLGRKAQVESIPFQSGTPELLSQNLDSLRTVLNDLEAVLNAVDKMLLNTLSGTGFPQSQLDGIQAQIDAFQAQVQGNTSGITAQINGIESFLSTYEKQQESTLISIENLKKQRDILQKQLDDAGKNALIGQQRTEIGSTRTEIGKMRTAIGGARSIVGAENGVQSAELNLLSVKNSIETTKKTMNASLATLQNSIDQAQLGYEEAVSNLDKFSIKAPISGTIGEVFVEEGEEIGPGTPLLSLVSTNDQEVEIYVTSDERSLLEVGKTVTFYIGEQSYFAHIESISDIANSQLQYKVTFHLDQITDSLGEVVTVEIPLDSEKQLVPLQYVTIESSSAGVVWVWNGSSLEKVQVSLGKVRGKDVEVLTDLSPYSELVVSPMTTYDPKIHTPIPK